MPLRHWTCVAAFCVVTGALHLGAAEQSPPATETKQQSKLLTLSGCIVPDPGRPGKFTLSDGEQAGQYRLTGTDVHNYVGRRVEMSGTTSKRLTITGGLYPSPNVAAQAGAIDPSKAAIAASAPNAGTGPTSEFRVRSVRAIPGPCPDR